MASSLHVVEQVSESGACSVSARAPAAARAALARGKARALVGRAGVGGRELRTGEDMDDNVTRSAVDPLWILEICEYRSPQWREEAPPPIMQDPLPTPLRHCGSAGVEGAAGPAGCPFDASRSRCGAPVCPRRRNKARRCAGAARARMRSAIFSAIMIVVAFRLPVTICGMIEASTTRSPSIPCTRP